MRYPVRLSVSMCLFVVSGCAFSPSQDGAPASVPGPVVTTSPEPTVDEPIPARPVPDQAKVSWKLDDTHSRTLVRPLETVSRDLGKFRAPAPITLPQAVPDAISMELQLPVSVGRLSSSALKSHVLVSLGNDQASKEIAFQGVAFSQVNPEHSTVAFTASGLRAVFSDTSEGSAQVIYRLERPDQTTVAEVRVGLRTPPVIMHIKQTGIRDWMDVGYSLPTAVQHLETGGYRLDLLQAIEVRNDSYQSATVSAPVKAAGKLVQHTREIKVEGSTCSHTVQEVMSEMDWPEEVRVLALSGDLKKNFTEVAKTESLERTTLTLAPGEAGLFGVYGLGEKAKAWSFGTLRLTAPETRIVADHCENRCGQFHLPPYAQYGSFETGWQQFEQLWPSTPYGAAGVQFPRTQINDCMACSRGDQGGCDRCRAWEESSRWFERVGIQTGCNLIFCGYVYITVKNDGNPPKVDYGLKWEDVPIYTAIPAGVVEGSLLLNVDPVTSSFRARFADVGSEEDPEERTFPAFSSQVTLDRDPR